MKTCDITSRAEMESEELLSERGGDRSSREHNGLHPEDCERLRSALHGGLGQLLTSISFIASSLRQKLAARELPEASDAEEILSLTGRAISETQALVQDSSTTNGHE